MRLSLQSLKRTAAIAFLAAAYGTAALLSRSLSRRGPHAWQRTGRILVLGTFHNPNWYHSHVQPLVRSRIGEVIVICDAMEAPIEGVRFACPPRWMAATLSSAGAKFLWAIGCGLRYRPDLYMGYHIFPGALTALVVARLFNRSACYQATSGQLELEGGGWHAENRILRALQRPSPYVERLASRVVQQFDLVVVRGTGAQAYVREMGYCGRLAVITGSVDPPAAWSDFDDRPIDLAFVGRLTELKQPERFIAVVAAVAKVFPGTRAVLIGEGPEADTLDELMRQLGLESNIEFLGKRADVTDLLAMTRIFVLPSRWEGVSIAMLEAMAAGAVPVVADVGDLRNVIRDEVNGFIVSQDDVATYARQATRLLSSPELWRRCSKRAVKSALASSGTDTIARRWERNLRSIIAKPPQARHLTRTRTGS